MIIQFKLQPHPNDGSRSKWKSRDGSFDRTFAKEKDDGGGKASFARFWHSDMRTCIRDIAKPTGGMMGTKAQADKLSLYLYVATSQSFFLNGTKRNSPSSLPVQKWAKFMSSVAAALKGTKPVEHRGPYLSVRSSVHPFVCLFIHLSICISVYPSVRPSAYLSIHPSVHPFFGSSVHPSK